MAGSFLGILDEPTLYNRASGASTYPIPGPLQIMTQAPPDIGGVTMLSGQLQQHVTRGGVLVADSGARLSITTTVSTPLGSEERVTSGIVIEEEAHEIVSGPAQTDHFQPIGTDFGDYVSPFGVPATNDPIPQIWETPSYSPPEPVEFAPNYQAPPPIQSAPVISDNPVGNAGDIAQPDLPELGCETTQDGYYDDVLQQDVRLILHFNGSDWEVISGQAQGTDPGPLG